MNAQNNKWKSYRAYQNATIVAVTPNYVFGIYDGSLLSYSVKDDAVKTYSIETGLSDTDISFMKYHPGIKCLVLVYESGNIDLFFSENDITNISSLKEKEMTNKKINNVDLVGNYAYISGTFGFIEIDLQKREIKNDCSKWGIDTRSVCEWNGYLYTSTEEGVLKINLSQNPNLQDKESWVYQPLSFPDSDKDIEQLLIFKDHLVFNTHNYVIWCVDENYSVKMIRNGYFKGVYTLKDELVIIRREKISFYSDFSNETEITLTADGISSQKEGTYWIARNSDGLTEIAKDRNSSEFTIKSSGIKVNSPIRNYAFRLKYTDNKLMVTGGSRWTNRNNIPGTFMVYEDKKWYNMDNDKITEAIQEQTENNKLVCKDLMSAVVDPTDPNRFFISAWGEGVYELQKKNSEFELIKLHSYFNTNNALQTIFPGSSSSMEYVRVDGLAFDKNNNLFIGNTAVSNSVVVKKKDNTWNSFYHSEIAGGQLNELIVTRNNLIWGNIYRQDKLGIFVYNNKNTIDNTLDDELFYSKAFADQSGKNFGPGNYLCLAEDLNGIVWAGTDIGPIYFTSPAQVRDGRCNRLIGTDEYGQGYYVLEGIRINTIAIDGANRKWFGTEDSGVFLLDQTDGTIKVENFNTKNSQILSDRVNSIAIDPKSGEVFIGTSKGLCSYQSDASEGKSDYSEVSVYPNPVYPLRNSQVTITGLMSNSALKITDVAGNLIKEANSLGGQYTWDCTDAKKEPVKAGIYLVYAIASDGSQGAVTKIMVIR